MLAYGSFTNPDILMFNFRGENIRNLTYGSFLNMPSASGTGAPRPVPAAGLRHAPGAHRPMLLAIAADAAPGLGCRCRAGEGRCLRRRPASTERRLAGLDAQAGLPCGARRRSHLLNAQLTPSMALRTP
ncbi:hypothetical protein O181_083869 [Austropuccinia psidii MF-1]|uniref:Uncharacterized protein n=1 Tax=Austropuccinia psidii MF-1 TaxID=1389203 RepID=A0A9Q3FS16_9BASI|nr:hypothetical protein [Austropuccinia psidii MF-1]